MEETGRLGGDPAAPLPGHPRASHAPAHAPGSPGGAPHPIPQDVGAHHGGFYPQRLRTARLAAIARRPSRSDLHPLR